MYLSCLLIDVGSNPDRPRPGRLWLRNLYHVHQRLCMAFPSDPRRKCDPEFLAPYAAQDFPEQRHLADKKKTEVGPEVLKQVHSPRNTDAGFLFRIDPGRGGRAMILVQSAAMPDWGYAFHNAGYLLAAPPQVKTFDPFFKAGQHLRFRLVANPTRRLSKRSLAADGQPIRNWANKEGKGMRVPVPEDNLIDWLTRRAEKAGFSVDRKSASVSPGYVYFKKPKKAESEQNGYQGEGTRLRTVRYEGTLKVTDPTRFREAMLQGIGPGKAFGFGLLSVAPCRAPLAAEAP